MLNLSEKTSKSACHLCQQKQNGFLCSLTPSAARELEAIKTSTSHPAGSLLFMENESPRGIFLVCSGKVKLSVSAKSGKTLILQIAGPGEIVGLTAAMSGASHEASAEALYPTQVEFIRRDDFLNFLNRFPEAYRAITHQLNLQYGRACDQLRTIGLSGSAQEKLARLFLHWSMGEKRASDANQIKVPLTHEQIAACLGSTRETVTRTLNDFKNKHLVTFRGSTVLIPDRSALMAVSGD